MPSLAQVHRQVHLQLRGQADVDLAFEAFKKDTDIKKGCFSAGRKICHIGNRDTSFRSCQYVNVSVYGFIIFVN